MHSGLPSLPSTPAPGAAEDVPRVPHLHQQAGAHIDLCSPRWQLEVLQGPWHLRGHLIPGPRSYSRSWRPSAGPHVWPAQEPLQELMACPPGQHHKQLSRVKVERGHGRAAAASLTNTLYGCLNVHPSTCAVPAPPGLSIDWFSRTHSRKFP